MDNLITIPLIRATSPMATFLNGITTFITRFLNFIAGTLSSAITSEPLFMFGFGFVAVMGTVGIVRRLLSRD